MTQPSELDHIEVIDLTLCRDDFIGWILRSTNEDSEFRVYKNKGPSSYILVCIDRNPFKE